MDSNPNTLVLPQMHGNVRQASKANTRRTILQVAEELFSAQGYAETRAEQIAKKTGVAVGTIYLHFGNKDGLLREVLLEAVNELHQRVSQVYQDPTLDLLAQARAHVETIVLYVEEHERLADFVLRLMMSGHPAARPMLDRGAELVEQSIRQGQEQGICRRDIDPRLAARAETRMNLGLLAWWAEDPRRASREEIIDTLTKIRFSGLHSQAKG